MMNVVQLPSATLNDIPAGLRALADQIESGEYGEVCNLAWVLDADYSPVSSGLLGQAGSPDAVFTLLLELGKLSVLKRMGK